MSSNKPVGMRGIRWHFIEYSTVVRTSMVRWSGD